MEVKPTGQRRRKTTLSMSRKQKEIHSWLVPSVVVGFTLSPKRTEIPSAGSYHFADIRAIGGLLL